MFEILAGLATFLSVIGGCAYKIEKKKGINSITCALLCAGALPFWLIVSYSIYMLVGESLALFNQPKVPDFVRVLWPGALIPYAPLAVALFAWWETFLFMPYWVREENESEVERRNRLEWYLHRVRMSIWRWIIALVVFLVAVQCFYRTSLFLELNLPAPLP